jgi:hypothetical protein
VLEFGPGVPLPEARHALPAHASEDEKIQYVERCLNARFSGFLHLYKTLVTADFQTKPCARWQKEEFDSSPKEILAVYRDKAKVRRD